MRLNQTVAQRLSEVNAQLAEKDYPVELAQLKDHVLFIYNDPQQDEAFRRRDIYETMSIMTPSVGDHTTKEWVDMGIEFGDAVRDGRYNHRTGVITPKAPERSFEERVKMLQAYAQQIVSEVEYFEREFKPGDLVTTDEGNLALVTESEETEGSNPSVVVYNSRTGECGGPYTGYRCIMRQPQPERTEVSPRPKVGRYPTGPNRGEPIMHETSPGHWNDHYNDVFVDKTTQRIGGLELTGWQVRERCPGNHSVVWATFEPKSEGGLRGLEKALRLAERLVIGKGYRP